MSTLVHGQAIHTGHKVNLDFTLVHRFHQTRLSGEMSCHEATPGSWNNLPTTSMDCVCVQSNVVKVETAGSQIFIAKNSL